MKEKLMIMISFFIFCFCVYASVAIAENNMISVMAEADNSYNLTVVLDAGHGGEDSGAVGFDNTYEKELNLSIVQKIISIFDIFGIKYVAVRDSDTALGDTSLSTVRERKISDIHKRYELINSESDAVLLSIHQNYFPVEKYSGAQVFYAAVDESELIAENIQKRIINMLQIENNRQIKQTDNSIYLLAKAKCPSVMVECGFMSNLNELTLLKDETYQKKMSYLIVRGMIDYIYQKSPN